MSVARKKVTFADDDNNAVAMGVPLQFVGKPPYCDGLQALAVWLARWEHEVADDDYLSTFCVLDRHHTWAARLMAKEEAPPHVTHACVRRVARALWEAEGRPHGRAAEHWREAVARTTSVTRF